jgi:ABC-type transporter Mla subunit MlaD
MKRRGLLLAGVAAAAAGLVLAGRGGSGGAYTVRAEFADAAGLRGHSQVKVGGVAVGSVESLAVTPRNTALVTLKLSDTRVGAGARAAIRPVNLLGEKYVDLQPGDQGRRRPSGSLIPRSRTATPVELDQLLDTLDASTRFRLQVLIDESGEALGGRGADFGATLRALPPALDQAGAMVGAFAHDNRVLGRLVTDSDRVIGAMAGQRRDLGALVGTTNSALGAVASRDAELGQTIAEAAPAVAQMRTTLGRLRRAAAALQPAAHGLRTSAPGLAATLRALPGFAVAARPTLRTARSVAPDLTRLGVEATPVVARLRPVAARLDAFGGAFRPVSTTFDRGVGDLLGFVEGWARAIQVGDGAGHMFRNQLVMSPEIVQRLLAGYLRPSRRAHRRAVHVPRPLSRVPVGAPQQPKLPAVPLPDAPKAVHELIQAIDQAPAAASPQASELLNYLLGK